MITFFLFDGDSNELGIYRKFYYKNERNTNEKILLCDPYHFVKPSVFIANSNACVVV